MHNNTGTNYNNSEHDTAPDAPYTIRSTLQHPPGAGRTRILFPSSRSPTATTAHQRQAACGVHVEEEAADLRDQMHQVMDDFRLQLDVQRARQQAVESEQSAAMAAQAVSIAALSHHVEDRL